MLCIYVNVLYNITHKALETGYDIVQQNQIWFPYLLFFNFKENKVYFTERIYCYRQNLIAYY